MSKRGNKSASKQENKSKLPSSSKDSKIRKGSTDTNIRSSATVKRLKMYNSKPQRNKEGKIVYHELQSKDLPNTRIQPDRRWFGNTRVIAQKQLDDFRESMAQSRNDAYTIVMQQRKLPMQLLKENPNVLNKGLGSKLTQYEPFEKVFSQKHRRKRPRLSFENLEEFQNKAEENNEKYDTNNDQYKNLNQQRGIGDVNQQYDIDNFDEFKDSAKERIFTKGQSKRIWGELYKVIDSSDVIIQVLDARDPYGTRCRHLEQYLKQHAQGKHMILILNKCDLVPSFITKKWLYLLSREYPTLAFRASITNPFGKGALLSLLRQIQKLRSDKKQICVGFAGYPNVGKSSVINTLKSKKVCTVAPIPGETKVWQYITLMKKVYLIDCPGVVYKQQGDSAVESVLKGVVRIENLEDATEYIPEVLKRVKDQYLKKAYKITQWTDSIDFLTQLANRYGKLLPKGEPDLGQVSKMVLHDWQRGRLPYFSMPSNFIETEKLTDKKDQQGPEVENKQYQQTQEYLQKQAIDTANRQTQRKIPSRRDREDGEQDNQSASASDKLDNNESDFDESDGYSDNDSDGLSQEDNQNEIENVVGDKQVVNNIDSQDKDHDDDDDDDDVDNDNDSSDSERDNDSVKSSDDEEGDNDKDNEIVGIQSFQEKQNSQKFQNGAVKKKFKPKKKVKFNL